MIKKVFKRMNHVGLDADRASLSLMDWRYRIKKRTVTNSKNYITLGLSPVSAIKMDSTCESKRKHDMIKTLTLYITSNERLRRKPLSILGRAITASEHSKKLF